MDVLSTCPLRVASVMWQPRPGAFVLTVVCKATYVLAPGVSRLGPTQDEPSFRDEHWNADERRSLACATDLAPFKRRADVLLVGHAHAPGGQPVSLLRVRLVVGEIDKTIAVHGDRSIAFDDRIREPARFLQAPLVWERAAGGPGTQNPAGMRLDGPPDARGAIAVPNLTPPDFHLTGRHDRIPPAGFAPLAPSWPSRLDRLHGHALRWDHRRWNELPLPDDIDAGYFNAAPSDQQVSALRSDERLVLENLLAGHPRLVTNLQAVSPRAMTDLGDGPAREVRLRCDTLAIDTDRGTASLVWRGTLPLAHPAQSGRVVVSLEAQAAPPLPLPAPAATLAKLGRTRDIDPEIVRRAAMPFGAGAAIEPPAAPAPAELTGSIDLAIVRRGDALPFQPAAVALFTPPAPSPGVAATPARLGDTWSIDPSVVKRAALPFDATPASTPPPPAWVDPAAPEPPPLQGRDVAPVAADELPAPPAMIGPLARLEMAAAPPAEPAAAAEAAAEPPAAPVEEAPPEAAPALPLDAYPVERCAAIAASIARRKADKAAILERHELSADLWAELDRHWLTAVEEDLEHGKAALLHAYDEAYVAQLEAERGAITVAGYARLAVAAERGAEQETLAALDLPRGAMLRLRRVWLKKTAADGALARRVREAIAGEE